MKCGWLICYAIYAYTVQLNLTLNTVNKLNMVLETNNLFNNNKSKKQ